MISKTKSYILFLTLLSIATATLSVYNLQALGENDQTLLNISYSIANYGFAPYNTQNSDLAKQSWEN